MFLLARFPLILGVLFGVPLFSSEYESGAYRFLFTQGVGRWRYAKTTITIHFIFILLFSFISSACIHHFFVIQSRAEPVTIWTFGVFISHPLIITSLTLASFAIGVWFGAVLKRVVSAQGATLLFRWALDRGVEIIF
ncbi:MAG: hypothetical protein WDO06_00320 [Actinomycetota bacterium]